MRESSRRQLNEILEARVEEIFDRVYAEVLRVGMEKSLLEGAVLTGGGAMLPGMCDIGPPERVCVGVGAGTGPSPKNAAPLGGLAAEP